MTLISFVTSLSVSASPLPSRASMTPLLGQVERVLPSTRLPGEALTTSQLVRHPQYWICHALGDDSVLPTNQDNASGVGSSVGVGDPRANLKYA